MRLITPYTYYEVITYDNVIITDADIVNFTNELPDNKEYALAYSTSIEGYENNDNTKLILFENEDYVDFDFKSIILLSGDSIVGIINEDTRQRITCKILGLRITLNKVDTLTSTGEVSVNVSLAGHIDENNSFYRESYLSRGYVNKSDLELLTDLNDKEVVKDGLIINNQAPYIKEFSHLYLPSSTRRFIMLPNNINGVDVLGLLFGDDGVDEAWIDFNNGRCYSTAEYPKLRGYNFTKVTPNNMIGFLTTAGTGGVVLDRLFADTVNPPSARFFYSFNHGSDIIQLVRSEEAMIRVSYSELSAQFEDIFGEGVIRIMSPDHLVFFDINNNSGYIFDIKNNKKAFFNSKSTKRMYIVPWSFKDDDKIYIALYCDEFTVEGKSIKNSWIILDGNEFSENTCTTINHQSILFKFFGYDYNFFGGHILNIV